MIENKIEHLAIIMDGNGRWAEQKGLKRTDGHKEGANVVREITKWCAKNNIAYLSLYAFSTENWLRPKIEVDFLMKLLEKYLKNEVATYEENNIRFKAIGDMSGFSKRLRELIISLEEKTSSNTALTQILALNYGSKDEIARAIVSLNKKYAIGSLSKDEVLERFEECLDTSGIPSVDLLIRTGGEMRLSNFLLYQCSYAELYFTKTLFPDFRGDELAEIIKHYKQRHRRFGGV